MRRLVLVLVLLFAVTQFEDAEARRGRGRGGPGRGRVVRRQGLPRRAVIRRNNAPAIAQQGQNQGQGQGIDLQLDPNGSNVVDNRGFLGGQHGGLGNQLLGGGFPLIDGNGRPIDPSAFQDPNGNGNLSTGISPESEFRISFGNVSRCIANLTNRLENSCTAVIPAQCAPRQNFGGFFSSDRIGNRQVLRFDAIGSQFVEVEFACLRNEVFPIPSERTGTFRRIAGDPRFPGFLRADN